MCRKMDLLTSGKVNDFGDVLNAHTSAWHDLDPTVRLLDKLFDERRAR